MVEGQRLGNQMEPTLINSTDKTIHLWQHDKQPKSTIRLRFFVWSAIWWHRLYDEKSYEIKCDDIFSFRLLQLKEKKQTNYSTRICTPIWTTIMCMKYFNQTHNTQHCKERSDTEWCSIIYLLYIWKIPMSSDWLSFSFESNQNTYPPFSLCLCHSIWFKNTTTTTTVYFIDWMANWKCLSLRDSNQSTKYVNKGLHWVDGPVRLLLKSFAILFGLRVALNKMKKNNKHNETIWNE